MIGLGVTPAAQWSPDYNLVISPVMAGDEGEYRCEVNTGLHQVSRVNLQVRPAAVNCQMGEKCAASASVKLKYLNMCRQLKSV